MVDILDSIVVKSARKDHKCDYCWQKIAKGDSYELQRLNDDGRLYSWKNHVHCKKIAQHFKMYDDCYEGLTREDFIETIWEIYRNHNPEVKWNQCKDIQLAVDFCIKLMNGLDSA